jgi:hypothetical protein
MPWSSTRRESGIRGDVGCGLPYRRQWVSPIWESILTNPASSCEEASDAEGAVSRAAQEDNASR